jgi:hypothetical protein
VPLALGDLQVRQRRFIPKTEHLPRQARDKHRESTQKKARIFPERSRSLLRKRWAIRRRRR